MMWLFNSTRCLYCVILFFLNCSKCGRKLRQAPFQGETSTFGVTRPYPYPRVLNGSAFKSQLPILIQHLEEIWKYPKPNSCSREHHRSAICTWCCCFSPGCTKECMRVHQQLWIFPDLPVCSLDLVPFTILTYSRSLKHHHSWRWHLSKRIS